MKGHSLELNSDQHYDVFVDSDVGSGERHPCALDASGRRLHDRPLATEQANLRHSPALTGSPGL